MTDADRTWAQKYRELEESTRSLVSACAVVREAPLGSEDWGPLIDAESGAERVLQRYCDHEFIGPPHCAKCGWEPPAVEPSR